MDKNFKENIRFVFIGKEMGQLIVVILLLVFNVNACGRFQKGFYWAHDDLIDSAEVIVVVEAKVKNKKYYSLKTVEKLKGKPEKEYIFEYDKRDSISDTDFNAHNDSIFWNSDVGRSEFFAGECKAAHTFTVGERYVYFPDALGSKKSAERIGNQQDLWYKYIKNKLSGYCEGEYFENKSKLIAGLWRLIFSRSSLNEFYKTDNFLKEEPTFLCIKDNTITHIKEDETGMLVPNTNVFKMVYEKMIIPKINGYYRIHFKSDTLIMSENGEGGDEYTIYYFLRDSSTNMIQCK